MFFYALDVPAPSPSEEIVELVERNNGKMILLFVILLCVAVGIVYGFIIKKNKKSDSAIKEETAEENQIKND